MLRALPSPLHDCPTPHDRHRQAPCIRRHRRPLRGGGDPEIDANTRAGGFLGHLVRPVQIARPDPGEAGRRLPRRVRAGEGGRGQGAGTRRRVPDPLGAHRDAGEGRAAGGRLPRRAAGRPTARVPEAPWHRTGCSAGASRRTRGRATGGPARGGHAPAQGHRGRAGPGRTEARPGAGAAADRRGSRGRTAARCPARQPGHRRPHHQGARAARLRRPAQGRAPDGNAGGRHRRRPRGPACSPLAGRAPTDGRRRGGRHGAVPRDAAP